MSPFRVILNVEEKQRVSDQDGESRNVEEYVQTSQSTYTLYKNRRFEFSNIDATRTAKINLQVFPRSSS